MAATAVAMCGEHLAAAVVAVRQATVAAAVVVAVRTCMVAVLKARTEVAVLTAHLAVLLHSKTPTLAGRGEAQPPALLAGTASLPFYTP